MNQDIHDQATDYVLGELNETDSVVYETHLGQCPDCRVLVDDLRQGAIELAVDQSEEPPRHLRTKVLEEIRHTSQEAEPLAPVVPIRPRPRWVATGIAAAAVLIALLGWSALGTGRLVNSVRNDPSSVTIQATAAAGQFDSARVVYSGSRDAAVLVVEGLEQLPAERTYELWVVDGDEVLPAGLFNTGAEGEAAVLVEGEIRPGMVVAVTEEPAGGVPVATGEILFSAAVDA